MAAASAFSYAQAAKGQGTTKASATTPASESNPQSTASEPGTGEKSAAAASSTDVTETTQDTAPQSVTNEKPDLDSVSAVESETRTESVPERSPEQRRDDDSRRLDRPWRRNDKGTRSSSATTRSVDEHESRRPRKGKKGKSSEKQNGSASAVAADQESKTDETPKIELSEAPIPSVNIWQQRKEAHLAKAKPTDSTPQPAQAAESTNTTTTTKAPVAADAGSSDPVPAAAVVANGSKPSQKTVDHTKSERQASRGSRAAAKETKAEAPPSVDDASSWPTPEIAIKEDKKKPSDKGERVENTSQDDAKPRQKKEWVTYDYVPSVSFETQMPQIRGSKARGGAKGASSSRTSTTGPPQQAGDKANTTAPSSKGTENKERVRETHSGINGTASAPPSAKRTPADAPQSQGRGEQKKTAPTSAEKPKDVPSNQYSEHAPAHREGRSERGRGGYRGRGAHHGVHPHSQHQHQHTAPITAPPYAGQAARSQGPYSPPPRQGAHNQMYMPPSQRGGRGGRNNGTNYHRMSLPNGSTRLPPVETQFAAPYNYPVPPMSAVPYQQVPYYDSMMVAMVRHQIEYYFSIENLCKDMYLRKRMDSQGFVPLMFITAFKRMRELTPEMPLIRSVCEESTEVDYVMGEDDIERLRRRDGWQNFVLPFADRDELARNHGPVHLTFKNRSYAYAAHFNGMGHQGVVSPPTFQPQAYVEEHHLTNGTNGLPNGHGGSQLSAAVPDFSPSHQIGEQSFNAPSEAVNGHHAPAVNGLPNGVHTQ